MQKRWAEKWSELRIAAAAPAAGIGVLLLSIASFIVMLAVVMTVVRVVTG